MESLTLLPVLEALGVAVLVVGGAFVAARLLRGQNWFSVWIRRPFLFVAVALAAWLFLRVAGLAEAERYGVALVAATVLGGIVHIVISFVFSVFFSRQRDIHLPPLLRNVILVGTYVAILLAALKITVPGFSLSPLLLASGVLSLVVGLALQDVLSNLIAGITLSVERPVRKDDWVSIAGQEGKVVEVTWRTTKILTRQNDYIIFPNRTVAEREVRNYIYPSRLHMPVVGVSLPYSTLPSIAEEALLEAASRVPGVLRRPRPRVILRDFGDSAIDYGLVVSIDDYEHARSIQSDVRKEIYYALKRFGIVIPFPIRTLYHHKGEPHPGEWKEDYRRRLVVLSGPVRGERFPLVEETVRIGRGEECDIDLRDPAVSKEHAKIVFREGVTSIEDVGSTHGTLVNGVKVDKRRLRSGDEITIGGTILRYEEIEFS